MKVYREAVKQWGQVAQMRMLQEECGELIAAVNQYDRGRITAEHLAEEVADVLIMCEQARVILGADRVDEAKRRKLERLADRLVLPRKADDG